MTIRKDILEKLGLMVASGGGAYTWDIEQTPYLIVSLLLGVGYSQYFMDKPKEK